ncbi:MAG: DUF6340 family protein, partial [Bacteroidota bacterium]
IPLFLFFLAACSPIERMKTDVMEPAEMAFPEEVFTLTFLIPEPEIVINTRTYDEIDAKTDEELWAGITDIAAISPRFNVNALNLMKTDTIRQDTLKWKEVRQITDSLDVDGLMVLHQLKFSDSLDREIVYDSNYEGYYFIYKIQAMINWKIYEPQSQTIFNTHSYKEKFVWEGLGSTEKEAIRKLVDINRAFSSAAYWSGNDIGHTLFPYWVEQERFYFIRGNRYFRRARDHVENNNWQKAIDIWKKNFKLNSEDAAYRAAHNIAFACEMLGKIDLAIEWAEKALDIGYAKRSREYLDTLRERKEKLDKIDEQMPL